MKPAFAWLTSLFHRAAPIPPGGRVPADAFVREYKGHVVDHLHAVYDTLTHDGRQPLVFLAGDSSVDNKFWVAGTTVTAVNGYERALDPPQTRPDVCYHVNALLAARGIPAACINAAVEESTVGQRQGGNLLKQDRFLHSVLQPQDVVIVSVGGNDVVLSPSFATMSALSKTLAAPAAELEAGTAPGLSHFFDIFRGQVEEYLRALLPPDRAPRLVIVCMIYFPAQAAASRGWADDALARMGYAEHPQRLQAAIRAVYKHATQQIRLPSHPGTRVATVPLFDVLDASPGTLDYVSRVEPSTEGGRKMAAALLRAITAELGEGWAERSAAGAAGVAADPAEAAAPAAEAAADASPSTAPAAAPVAAAAAGGGGE